MHIITANLWNSFIKEQSQKIVWAILFIALHHSAASQFKEDFGENSPEFKEQGLKNWNAITGDGTAMFKQKSENGIASLQIDGTVDKRNIWYAFIHTNVAPVLDIKKLSEPGYGLRISIRVKSSHGPRRINMYLTAIDGSNLLYEFDLEEPGKWYELSMTATDFKASAEKGLLAQVSMMDWGNKEVYQLDIDYIKVDVVDVKKTKPDLGYGIEYRPPLKNKNTYQHEIKVSDDAMVNSVFADFNFNGWQADDSVFVLDASSTDRIIMKWDLSKYKGKKITEGGQLEITNYSVTRLQKNEKDFGEIRIFEIIGGNKNWKEGMVTYSNLMEGKPEFMVINTQTIVDAPVTPGKGNKTTVNISKPVLQRLIDGKTSGLAIGPLGAINFHMMSKDNATSGHAATLRFNVE